MVYANYNTLTNFEVNSVADGSIPDVPATYPQAAAIYKLYRAGIVEGADTTTRACKPNDPIRRCEVAQVLANMLVNVTPAAEAAE